MSEQLYDALEACLRELENGADLESVLARFPELSDDLRQILKTALAAKRLAPSGPSPDAVRRGRARLLQHAAEMRETAVKRGTGAGKSRTLLFPFSQRLAIVFSVLVLLFTVSGISGIGLVTASASALPGGRLYPVKRGWENIRLMFAIDPNTRTSLETQFYYERLSEVTALLAQGRVAPVEFAGIYLQVGGQVFVSGIQVIILDSTTLPREEIQIGDAVLVFGTTTPNGTVQANAIQLLTNPSVVPPGDPTPLPIPTTQVKPISTPLPAPTVMPTPTLQPAITIPQPTQTQPPTNNGNSNQNNNDNDDVDDDDDDDDNDNDDYDDDDDNDNDDD
jgi:hypothetical protein